MKSQIITIDASKKSFGRLASEVAQVLQGKLRADFKPHILAPVIVSIKNINEVQFTGKKLDQTKQKSHSGYPGGFSVLSLGDVVRKNPREALRKTVRGMLPVNKLRAKMLKNITFAD